MNSLLSIRIQFVPFASETFNHEALLIIAVSLQSEMKNNYEALVIIAVSLQSAMKNNTEILVIHGVSFWVFFTYFK